MRARSQTAISVASRLNSFTLVSRSDDHLLTISSIVFPLSIEGGGTEIDAAGAEVDPAPVTAEGPAGAPNKGASDSCTVSMR